MTLKMVHNKKKKNYVHNCSTIFKLGININTMLLPNYQTYENFHTSHWPRTLEFHAQRASSLFLPLLLLIFI